jgi:N-acetylmuramoyl-L-alanine amidase
MKNTYMKTLAVACVAIFAFIGLQNSTVEAITEYRVVKGDSLWELGQQYGITIDDIKQDNNRHDDWIYIGEILQIPDKPKVVAIQSSKPEIETPEKEPEKPAVSISNEEKDLFARLVEAEAKGESYEGKVAVATVVLNRVDSPEFPNNVTDVINQVVGNSYAFSPVQNGEINKPASDEAKRAVDEALTRKDRLNDSIYFYNPDIATDDWIRTRDVVKTIDNHVFAK